MLHTAAVTIKRPFSRYLGQQMAAELIAQLGRQPGACWLFCSPGQGLDDLLEGINDALDTPHVIGCTTDGEISNDGLTTGAGVLGGIASDQIAFQTAVATDLSGNSEAAGRALASRLSKQTAYVHLFSDGLTGNGCALLRGMSSVLGEHVPIAGGTAGDSGLFRQTWQFAGRRLLSDAAVAIGFTGELHLGTGIRSGWTSIGLPKKVTRAAGNKVYELNHEPALSVMERFLGKHAEKLPAIGVEYPLSLIDQAGDVGEQDYHLLRATMSVDRAEGSITFAGEIPEGAMVTLTCADTASILEASTKAAQLALSDLGDHHPAMIFCFSCMARKIVLGRRTGEEIERIRTEIGPAVPTIGFYTYGEYCRIRCGGPNRLHNETVTLSVIGR